MTTGNLIAIIVGLLIVLAILWFMTRSRRHEGPGKGDSLEHTRQSAGAAPAGSGNGRVTSSAGVATADAQAGRTGAGMRTAAGGTAVGTAAAAGSQGGARSNDEVAAGGSPDVHDSQAGPGASGVAAIAASVATAGAAVAGAGVATGSADPITASQDRSRADQGAERVEEAMSERKRIDPANDGHPVPADSRHGAGSDSAAPGVQPSGDRANAPVDKDGDGFDGVQGGVGTMRSPDMSKLAPAEPALEGDYTVDTDDAAHDVREMMKILNLRESEASRLHLSSDEFESLRSGDNGGMDDVRLASVASQLRRMIR